VVTPARVAAAICLIVPIVLPLWVPLYNRITPTLGGIPFFYWWQILWVIITAVLVAVAYVLVRHDTATRKRATSRHQAAGGSDPAAGTEQEAGR
jgi:hypothetical protein